MKRRSHLRPFSLFASMAALLISSNLHAFAQQNEWTPGERVQYKATPSQDVWEEGTFVGKSYDGSQPIVRFKPDRFSPRGEQKALRDWNQIRRLQARPQENQADKGHTQTTVQATPPLQEHSATRTGDGLMSQADIIGFLKTNLGVNPFGNPKKDEIKAGLAVEIKRRGLSFHFDPQSAFFYDMSKYIGVTMDVSSPLKDNFGPPTKQGWLTGAWRLDKIGATTEFAQGGYLWRKEASAVANVGQLTIGADGTYVWQANAPAATFRGQWRKATAAEMKTQGGDGVVLLKAKEKWDWIVTQNRAWAEQGAFVWISELGSRQVREIGSRGGK